MKMYEQAGYNRLAKLIAMLSFPVSLVALIAINEGSWSTDEVIVSAMAIPVAFIVTRLVYWVIDGFKKPKN